MTRPSASLKTAGLAAAVLGAALLLFRFGVYDRDSAPEPIRPAAAAVPGPQTGGAVVLSVSGEVKKAQGGGSWADLAAGETLRSDEELRTGKGARTDLRVGGSDRVTVFESSSLVIQDLTQDVRRLRLLRGRISVDQVDAHAPPFRVEDGNGSAAEGRKARFSVLSTGTAIAVVAEKGDVGLTSAARTVKVTAGMESVAVHGRAPTAPRPVPTRILLQVANAVIGASAEACAELEGSVPPGAELTVGGVLTQADAAGRFHLRVPRTPGKRSVEVALRDASGRTRTREVPCAPSPADVHDVAIKWRDEP